ncbi:hypothetical protein GDO86_004847 [Hymenochirus boettgeri]|nr:hypothetical protein GDO86_004847 [Hymenochirus boettgeri]
MIPNPTVASTVTLPVLQQPSFGNYIITTKDNIAESANTVCVEQKKTVFLDKSQVTIASALSPPTQPTFVMVNPASPTVTVQTPPILPSGHHLQIPANAVVKSVPASSLPIAVQHKIISAASLGDVNKNPSVIYVSPVNTVRTLATKHLEPVSPKAGASTLIQVQTPKPCSQVPEAQKPPMKWIVEENKESAACLVPVKSSNDTASKILKLLSSTQTSVANLANVLPASNNFTTSTTKIMPIKDNALVMCNNRIYLLAKRGSDVFNTQRKIPETPTYASPEKPLPSPESIKDISNKVVEVVLSKNKASLPITNQKTLSPVEKVPQNTGSISPKFKQNFVEMLKQKVNGRSDSSGMPVTNGSVTENRSVFQKPPKKNRVPCLPKVPSSVNLNNVKEEPHEPVSIAQTNQAHSCQNKASAGNPISDECLRRKFGLIKQERIVLKRLQDQTSSGYKVESEQQIKRKILSTDPVNQVKRSRSTEGHEFGKVSLTTMDSFPEGSSKTLQASVASSGSLSSLSPLTSNPLLKGDDLSQGENHKTLSNLPSVSHETSSSVSYQFNPERVTPRPYSPANSSSSVPSPVDLDETVRDEKIRRLKDLLREREEELEAIRRQIRN